MATPKIKKIKWAWEEEGNLVNSHANFSRVFRINEKRHTSTLRC